MQNENTPINLKEPQKNWFFSHKVLISTILILLLVVIIGIIDYARLQKDTQKNIDQTYQTNP